MTEVMTPDAALADGSPKAASAALDAMTARFRAPVPDAPRDAAGARAKLDALTADASFREDYFAGEAGARRQIDELNRLMASADPTGEILAGNVPPPGTIEVTSGGDISMRASAVEVAALREGGIGDDVIRQILNAPPVSPAERSLAQQHLAMRMSDTAPNGWVSRLLAGDVLVRRELTHLSAILRPEHP